MEQVTIRLDAFEGPMDLLYHLIEKNEIDIYDLLYQSVILNIPNKKVCGINCNEGLFVSDEDMEVHDERMDVFKNIKINPKNN